MSSTRVKYFIGLLLLFNLSACGAKQESLLNSDTYNASAPAENYSQSQTNTSTKTFSKKQNSLMIAYKYYFQLAVPEHLIAKYWSEDQKRCKLPECEIIYADFQDAKVDTKKRPYSKAILKFKINTMLYPQFADILVKRPEIQVAYCKTESENKKQEFIDTQSRLKSLQILKEKLETLIQNQAKTSNIKDTLSVEAELARVQQEIEQMTSQKLGIEDSVNRSTIEIEYNSLEEKSGSNYYLEPITQAFAKGLYDFSEGLGSAISFIFIILPWFILVVPFLWSMMKILNIVKVKISDWKLFKAKNDTLPKI